MHRFTFSAALALACCVGLQQRAFAQQGEPPYGEDPEAAPYQGEVEPPYDDYDVEPLSPGGEEYGPSDQPYDQPSQPYDQPYDAPPDQPYEQPHDQPPAPPYDEQSGSIDDFYDALQPYGQWVRTPEYGLIWVPYQRVVGASFVPYSTGGTWVYTDAGWMFVT